MEDTIITGTPYEMARTRKMNAEAEIAELQLKQVHNELVKVDDVVAAWDDTLSVLKSKLTAIPSKAAPLVFSASSAGEAKDIVEKMLIDALQELSNYDPRVSATETAKRGVEGGDEVPKAAKKANSKRVGRPRKTAGLTK